MANEKTLQRLKNTVTWTDDSTLDLLWVNLAPDTAARWDGHVIMVNKTDNWTKTLRFYLTAHRAGSADPTVSALTVVEEQFADSEAAGLTLGTAHDASGDVAIIGTGIAAVNFVATAWSKLYKQVTAY